MLALVLFTATHFFPSLPLLLFLRTLLRHLTTTPQKGYDIILEWALRYIALFPPSFLSISPSAALLLPLGDLLTDDWGTTFVHYMTSIPSSRT